jgi:glycosyltransferase involved in cell wall biosynthesis
MKHIALISENFHPKSYADAIRMKPIVDELEKRDSYRVTVYTSKDERRKNTANIIHNIISPPGKSSNVKRLFKEFLCSIEIFLKLLVGKKYDLYIVTSPPYFVTIASVFAIIIRRGKYVIDIRDIYPEMFFNFELISENSFLGRLLTSITKLSYERSSLITTVTKGLKEEIKTKYNTNTSVKLIRNGFDKDLFIPTSQKYPKFTISLHGSIARYTDVGLILSLAEMIERDSLNIDIQVIGSGNKDAAFKECSYNCLKYYGRLSNKETAEKVSKSHLGISFRTNEFISKTSFPVKVYEYIGLRIPVIVTPRSEAGDFVEKKEIGYQFDNNELGDIFERIYLLYKNKDELDSLTNNIDNIRDKFTRENSSVKFAKSIDQILK